MLPVQALQAYRDHRQEHGVVDSIVHVANEIGSSPIYAARLLGFTPERHERVFQALRAMVH